MEIHYFCNPALARRLLGAVPHSIRKIDEAAAQFWGRRDATIRLSNFRKTGLASARDAACANFSAFFYWTAQFFERRFFLKINLYSKSCNI